MAYADYSFYTDSFFGDLIPEEEFPAMAEKASDYLDYITMGRASKDPSLLALKKACCAVAEDCFAISQSEKSSVKNGGALASQTVGSWSATYRSGEETAAAHRKQMYRTAVQYLAMTGLLYRGGNCKCTCPTP